MGRPRKPTALQIAAGDPRQRGKGKLQQRLDAEPIAEKGLPPCPEYLAGLARERYLAWSEDLKSMRLDAKPDGQMLEGACVAYQLSVEAYQRAQKDGILLELPIFDKEGSEIGSKLIPHPALMIASTHWKVMRAFCSEFGLSPVARTRLAIERQDDSDRNLHDVLSGPELTTEERARLQ